MLFMPVFSPFPLILAGAGEAQPQVPCHFPFLASLVGGRASFLLISCCMVTHILLSVMKFTCYQLVSLLRVHKRPGMGRVNSPGLCFLMVQAFAWSRRRGLVSSEASRCPADGCLLAVSLHGLLLPVQTGMTVLWRHQCPPPW